MEINAKLCYYASPIKVVLSMKRDIWIFLFVIGLLCFSWPVMSIFRHSLAASLFVVWFLFIALIFIIAHFSEREDGGK
jgi:uncharacterized membrane protein